MRNPRALVLAFALLIPACGDDGGGTTIDAAPGPSPVGRWRALPYAFENNPRPLDQRNLVVYGADGTLTTTIDGTTRMWTYTSEGTSIIATATDAGQPADVSFEYFIDGDVYVEDAFRPTVGDGFGPIDIWVNHARIGTELIDTRLDLRTGGSGEITTVRSTTGTAVHPVSYGGDGADLLITVEIAPGDEEQILARMQGGRLGTPYERIP